jgi:hypothetical protein
MKGLYLIALLLPCVATAQKQELSVGIGVAACTVPSNLHFVEKPKPSFVPTVQVSYFRYIIKHLQAGLSIGASSYRQKVDHAFYDINLQPIGNSHASMRYAEVAIPIKLEGRYAIVVGHSRILLGLNTGAVICTASRGEPKFNFTSSYYPDPTLYSYKNTTAFTAGAAVGYDHSIGKHLNIGITPAVNYVRGNFVPVSSTDKTISSFLDFQLQLVAVLKK